MKIIFLKDQIQIKLFSLIEFHYKKYNESY